MEQVRKVTSKVEDVLDQNMRWVKPYLPALGRFLIVVTFLEDALRSVGLASQPNYDQALTVDIRILTQWSDQIYYLQRHRKFPWGISHIFLLINVVVRPTPILLMISR